MIEQDGGEVLADGDRDNAHAGKFQKRVTDIRNLEASNALFIKLVVLALAVIGFFSMWEAILAELGVMLVAFLNSAWVAKYTV